jgi:hypothetical protein
MKFRLWVFSYIFPFFDQNGRNFRLLADLRDRNDLFKFPALGPPLFNPIPMATQAHQFAPIGHQEGLGCQPH